MIEKHSWTEKINVSLATIAIILSCYTFYDTNLRDSDLSYIVGSKLTLSKANNGSYRFTAPFNFTNESNNSKSIEKISLEITTDGGSYSMEWDVFTKIEDNDINIAAIAHPFTLFSKSSITKTIRFEWQARSKPKILLLPGNISFKFYVWQENHSKPIVQEFDFELTENIAHDIEQAKNRGGVKQINIKGVGNGFNKFVANSL